jgi:hypothetical protein
MAIRQLVTRVFDLSVKQNLRSLYEYIDTRLMILEPGLAIEFQSAVIEGYLEGARPVLFGIMRLFSEEAGHEVGVKTGAIAWLDGS